MSKYLMLLLMFCYLHGESFEEFKGRCNEIGAVKYATQKEAQKKLANSLYGVYIESDFLRIIQEKIVNAHEALTSHIIDSLHESSKAFLYIKYHNNYTAEIICHRQQYEKYIQYINNSINHVPVKKSPSKTLLWQNQPFDKIDMKTYKEQNYNSNRVKNYQEAKNYCQKLHLNAKKWRLPNILEINDIVSLSPFYSDNNQKVFIKKSFIGNMPSTNNVRFWLQDTDEFMDKAYYIDFTTNQIVTSDKDRYNYVMCVSDGRNYE